MKNNAASIWLASLLCVAAGLGIYHFAFERPARQRLLDELELKQQALAAKQAEIEARQKSAMDDSIAHARRAVETVERERMQELKQKALKAESLHAAQMAAQSLKTMVTEYHANHGQPPQSLTQLELPEHWAPSPKIQSVHVEPDRVRILLDNEHVKGSLVYAMHLHQGAYPDWQCSSPDIADIDDFLPACRYIGGG